jgi:ribonuclease G
MGKWEDIFQQLHNAKPPQKLLSELDKTSSILRDLLTDSFNRIVVNDKQLYSHIKTFLGTIAPEQVGIVKYHSGGKSIFDVYGVTKQIKHSFGKTATMSSGAYIVIEHTEAMHVVDVNSGHKMRNKDQAEAVLKVNLEAAEEVARQLRLRDIGGIIIIDFIDMRSAEHKKLLLSEMRKHMKKDRAQHTVLALSKFGLMQITRQRVRPEVNINTAEVCPSCNGTGKVNATILIEDDIERDLNFIFEARPSAKLTLRVHPFVGAYLRRGWWKSVQVQWYRKYKNWIRIMEDKDYGLNTYKFFDKNNDEIRL